MSVNNMGQNWKFTANISSINLGFVQELSVEKIVQLNCRKLFHINF